MVQRMKLDTEMRVGGNEENKKKKKGLITGWGSIARLRSKQA